MSTAGQIIVFINTINFKLKMQKIILSAVLYGSPNGLILREECRLKVFDNSIMMRVFGSTFMRMGSG